jgi:hypothetical protein
MSWSNGPVLAETLWTATRQHVKNPDEQTRLARFFVREFEDIDGQFHLGHLDTELIEDACRPLVYCNEGETREWNHWIARERNDG